MTNYTNLLVQRNQHLQQYYAIKQEIDDKNKEYSDNGRTRD